MHKHLNIAALQLRLWVVTVLLVVLGVALVAEFSDHSGYSDDKVRVRVPEMVEVTGDAEPPLSADHWNILPAISIVLPCMLAVRCLAIPRRHTALRAVSLRQRQPRAPPVFA